MPQRVDLTCERFGRLEVMNRFPRPGYGIRAEEGFHLARGFGGLHERPRYFDASEAGARGTTPAITAFEPGAGSDDPQGAAAHGAHRG